MHDQVTTALAAGLTGQEYAEAVRDSLGSGTLTVEVKDGSTLQFSGTFAGPMTAGEDGSLSHDVVLSGTVSEGGTPNAATWTCKISNASGRYVTGSFGPGGRFTSTYGDLVVGQSMRLNVSIAAAGGSTVLPAAEPDLVGGTVHTLLSEWSATGFQLLSTAPSAPTYVSSAHAGTCWDDARKTMWIFGAETHGTGMDNAVYGWRATDGKFIRQYAPDSLSGAGYMMDSDGVLWSSDAKVRPWGMHTYRSLRFVAASNEIEVMGDMASHAGITPDFENEEHTIADRVGKFWYYNVVTGAWRHHEVGGSSAFNLRWNAFPFGYATGLGWFHAEDTYGQTLTEAGSYSSFSVYNKVNTQYHSYMHVIGDVAYQVGGNADEWLYSKHPLDDWASSARFAKSAYPALDGLTMANTASVKMPNGKILLFPVSSSTYHALILDPAANTVTDTGHALSGLANSYYDLAAEWSDAHGCALLLSRRFAPNRVYAYRPE